MRVFLTATYAQRFKNDQLYANYGSHIVFAENEEEALGHITKLVHEHKTPNDGWHNHAVKVTAEISRKQLLELAEKARDF